MDPQYHIFHWGLPYWGIQRYDGEFHRNAIMDDQDARSVENMSVLLSHLRYGTKELCFQNTSKKSSPLGDFFPFATIWAISVIA